MTTDSEKELEEAATQYAIHKEDDRHKCPACGEETMWPKIKHDFIAGARYAAEKSAKEIAEMRMEHQIWEKHSLTELVKERDTLRAENEKQAARISELEAALECGCEDSTYCGVCQIQKKLLSPKDTQGEG